MAYFLALLACGVFVAADEHGSLGALGTILMALILVATIVPSLAVQARRFHDQDLSGWLVLLNLIPYLGTIIVLICMTREGTHGGNQFGPDPLGREPLPGE